MKRLLFVAAGLIVFALILPFLVPLDFLIPRIEQAVAGKIHEPVVIRSVRLVLLPLPGVKLGGISVGELQDIKADSVNVSLDVFSLFRQVKTIRKIIVESPSIEQDALERMAGWFKPEPGPSRAIVRQVALHRATLNLKAVTLKELNADAELDESGAFRQAQIEADDKSMTLAVAPSENGHYALDFEGKNWKPPVGPAVRFDRIRAQGWVNGDRLKVSEIDANLYGGSLNGDAVLGWHDGWSLQGKLHSRDAEIHQLASLMSPETNVSGKLDAEAQFSMRAKQAGRLFDAPAAEVEFKIKNGVLYNFDLVGAVKTLSKGGTRGGQTRFDDFNGHLQVAGKAYHFRQLKVSSGILAAAGHVDIAPSKELSGQMHVELKGTANLVSMPLQISGSLSNPLLRPTDAAIAGAVAGTAMLGPGVGTSLGAKAGDFVDRLFNGK